jgi:hypothetical protein
MRPSRSLAVILFAGTLAGLTASCGGSASGPATGAAGPSGDTSGEAVDAAPTSDAGGTVEAVTIADANYTTGSAHVEVSGGKQATLDSQLFPGVSMTTEGTTLLMYAAGEGENASVFSIANGADTGLAFTLSSQGIVTGGDGSTGCAIELTKNDGSGIEGRFTCRGMQTVGLDMTAVDVSATFSAAP